jgi:hypothetical protein
MREVRDRVFFLDGKVDIKRRRLEGNKRESARHSDVTAERGIQHDKPT